MVYALRMRALGIDYGSVATRAVLTWPDGRWLGLLFDGSTQLPSGVYLDTDATIVVGSTRVAKTWLAPEPDADEAPEAVDDEDADEAPVPPPLTVCPAAKFTAVIFPATGALRNASLFASDQRVSSEPSFVSL